MSRLDPSEARERLLNRVKDDNARIQVRAAQGWGESAVRGWLAV